MYTAAQMVADIAEATGYSKSDVRHVLEAQEQLIVQCIEEGEKVKVGQVVQLEVKIRKATKKRQGRNPRTGDAVTIAAKPATAVVKARVLVKGKNATPSLAVAKKALAKK